MREKWVLGGVSLYLNEREVGQPSQVRIDINQLGLSLPSGLFDQCYQELKAFCSPAGPYLACNQSNSVQLALNQSFLTLDLFDASSGTLHIKKCASNFVTLGRLFLKQHPVVFDQDTREIRVYQ